MNANQRITRSARRRIVAAAAAALFAPLALAGADTTLESESTSLVGASLPVAEFQGDLSAVANTWSRAGLFASVLAGEEVRTEGAAMRALPLHAQFQVRTRGSIRYLAEASRAPAAVYNNPSASDAEVAAMALATTDASERLERIVIVVDNERRDLLAVNRAVTDDFTSRWDIGPERARAIFSSAAQLLSSNPLVAPEVLAVDAVRTRRLVQGEQAFGGKAVSRVKEYLFEVPHGLGGIEIFGAGTTVAVHRSGQLASIRSIGPSVSVPASREMMTRLLPTDALTQRAIAEHPNATVVPLGLRYPWQIGNDAKLASRPREAFQVIPKMQADGREISGRAHFVFYSVEDERTAPLVWPRPNPSATGDVRR
jgi:hypothetical protein